MTHVMLDLETLGVAPGCVVLSIGAAVFARAESGKPIVGRTFYSVIDRVSCERAGLEIDDSTVEWWERQSIEAKKVLISANSGKADALGEVLHRFAQWIENSDSTALNIYGNGADFDLPILGAAYRAAAWRSPPWKPYSGRCYRTLKNLRPDIAIVKSGTAHNALDDAIAQASHASLLFEALGVT